MNWVDATIIELNNSTLVGNKDQVRSDMQLTTASKLKCCLIEKSVLPGQLSPMKCISLMFICYSIFDFHFAYFESCTMLYNSSVTLYI